MGYPKKALTQRFRALQAVTTRTAKAPLPRDALGALSSAPAPVMRDSTSLRMRQRAPSPRPLSPSSPGRMLTEKRVKLPSSKGQLLSSYPALLHRAGAPREGGDHHCEGAGEATEGGGGADAELADTPDSPLSSHGTEPLATPQNSDPGDPSPFPKYCWGVSDKIQNREDCVCLSRKWALKSLALPQNFRRACHSTDCGPHLQHL